MTAGPGATSPGGSPWLAFVPMDGGFGGDEDHGFLEDDDREADGVDEPILGWIPPEARAWRHPSEMGLRADLVAGHPVRRRRSRWWVTGTVSVAAAGSVAAMGLLLADSGASPGSLVRVPAMATVTSTTMGSGHTAPAGATVMAAAAQVAPSVVPLESSDGVAATGLTVDTGGVVIAPLSLVRPGATVWSTGPHGRRQRATVVATDPGTGLALLTVSGDHPVAAFADQDDLAAGAPVVEVAWPGGSPGPSSAPTTVLSTGTAIHLDPVTATLAATAVPGGTPAAAGCVLVDASGRVAGVEHVAATVDGRMVSAFLPGYLVLDVARQLVATGTVEHGWLGAIVASASPTSSPGSASAATVSLTGGETAGPGGGEVAASGNGVVVTSVVPGGAAAGAGLQPGDVIVGVDSQPVRSPAELRDHLYGEPPGASVTLAYVDGGLAGTTVAVLTAPPAGRASSPSP